MKNYIKHMSKQTHRKYHKVEEEKQKSTPRKIIDFFGYFGMILLIFWVPFGIIGLFTKK